MKIKNRIYKPVKTLVTKKDIGELLDSLYGIGLTNFRKEDIIEDMKYFSSEEDIYLIFDAQGVYGDIDIIPKSYTYRETVDRLTFLRLAAEPVNYLKISTDPGFEDVLSKLEIGTFFILVNTKKDSVFYGEEVFTSVSNRIESRIHEDVFNLYLFNKDFQPSDKIYRNNTVFYPTQW